jgi:hypothetical protein
MFVGLKSHDILTLVYQQDRRSTMKTSIKNGSFASKAGKLTLAASAAALFASTTATPAFAANDNDSTSVKCQGINACKGQSKCATATNACSGQNACKGQGWLLSPSADECVKQGGTVIK